MYAVMDHCLTKSAVIHPRRRKFLDSPATPGVKITMSPNANSPRSSSSSPFEKTPRGPQEYPLESLDNDGNDSGSSSQFVTIPRASVDSARLEEHSAEPLLPTSAHPSPPILPRKEEKGWFKCTVAWIIAWAKGPSPPHKYQITPLLRRWQIAPARVIDRYCPTKLAKGLLLLSAVITWFVIFLSILHHSVNGVDIPGYGKPVKLGCHDNLW